MRLQLLRARFKILFAFSLHSELPLSPPTHMPPSTFLHSVGLSFSPLTQPPSLIALGASSLEGLIRPSRSWSLLPFVQVGVRGGRSGTLLAPGSAAGGPHPPPVTIETVSALFVTPELKGLKALVQS